MDFAISRVRIPAGAPKKISRLLAGDLFSGRSRGVEVYPRQGKSPLEHQKISLSLAFLGGAFVRQLTERISADALRFFMLL